MEKCSEFIKKNSIFFLIGFAFVTMLTYVFKDLAFTNVGGIIYRCFSAALILAFAFFYFYKNTKIINLKTIIPLSIYVICGIVATSVSPVIIHANVSAKYYVESFFTLLMNAVSIFVLLDHLSNKHEEYEHRNLICYTVVWFTFFLTISTYVFQFKEIGKSFTEPDGWNYSVTSIFYIKTIYGYLLLMGSIFAIILMFNKDNIYFLFLPFYFGINAFISRNKTSLLFIILLIVGSLILFTIKNRKEKQKQLIIVYSILAGLILILSLLTLVEPLRFGIFEKFYYFIKTSIFENGKTVLVDRFNKWGAVFQRMKPFGYCLGYGEKLTQLIFNAYNTPLGDNIYITTLCTGGVIKLLLLLLLIGFIFKIYYKSNFTIYKKILITLVVGSLLLAGLFEDDYIYGFNVTSLFAAPFVFCSNKIIKNL